MPPLKVVSIMGTRPEVIRLSRVLARLDETVDHRIVHTGQNYDYELNGVFFEELAIRKPDHFLDVDTSSLGRTLGGVLTATERVLELEQPDAVLILGDTNSSLAAIMAKRMRITVYHMEAGNRCFDENVPEEANRRIVDHVADFNLAYTEHARRNLLAEGLHPRRVFVTGSPLREVLEHHRSQIDSSAVLGSLGLEPRGYFLVSIHREENVDDRDALVALLTSLQRLRSAYTVPVIVSTHPRTRKRLAALPESGLEGVQFHKPFGFLDYNRLQMNALCTLSDSGSISEESAILSFPAVTLRNATERPEALDTGSMVLTGLDPDVIEHAVRVVVSQFAEGAVPDVPEEYGYTRCSQRVVNLIVGTARLSKRWSNLASPPRFWD